MKIRLGLSRLTVKLERNENCNDLLFLLQIISLFAVRFIFYRNGISGSHRPHKRARCTAQSVSDNEILNLWWNAVESDSLLANGLPPPRHLSLPATVLPSSQTSVPHP